MQDLASTNGTFVNGRRVQKPIRLARGDELCLGGVRLVFLAPSPRGSGISLRSALLCLTVLFLLAFGAVELMLNRGLLGRVETAVSGSHPLMIAARGRLTPAAARAPAPGEFSAASPAASPTSAPTPAWLVRLNDYRRIAGVAPLNENTALDNIELSHARYLLINYSADFRRGRSPGSLAHTELPSESGYSAAGALAAAQSDVYDGCGQGSAFSETQMIDGWIEGAFHRLSLLNPNLSAGAFGYYSADGCWASALRLVPAPHPVWSKPVEFPGDGSRISLTRQAQGEWPDPLTSCGYQPPAGLPITFEFGYGHTPNVRRTALTLDGRPLEHCEIDTSDYRTPDSTAQAWGRRVLTGFGAVILLPRHPLSNGAYSVEIDTDPVQYRWSFQVDEEAMR